ncbi:MAG: hypothetical protein DSY42_02080 [Aquifex sp.]|nr:MAG: hypothetical protein DSY42_02080 [Aquifex sp.]
MRVHERLASKRIERLRAVGFAISISKPDRTYHVSISLPKGGGDFFYILYSWREIDELLRLVEHLYFSL